MVTNTANRPSHERDNTQIPSLQAKAMQEVQSYGFWAIWHSGTTWPSGHLGLLEPPGNVQGSTDTSGMTLWHAGTLLAWWHAGTVDRPMAQANQWWYTALSLWRLMGHTDDVVGLQDGWWWCIWWWSWCHFWVRAGRKPVHTQKTGPTP